MSPSYSVTCGQLGSHWFDNLISIFWRLIGKLLVLFSSIWHKLPVRSVHACIGVSHWTYPGSFKVTKSIAVFMSNLIKDQVQKQPDKGQFVLNNICDGSYCLAIPKLIFLAKIFITKILLLFAFCTILGRELFNPTIKTD